MTQSMDLKVQVCDLSMSKDDEEATPVFAPGSVLEPRSVQRVAEDESGWNVEEAQ